jgi:hypothetical protein
LETVHEEDLSNTAELAVNQSHDDDDDNDNHMKLAQREAKTDEKVKSSISVQPCMSLETQESSPPTSTGNYQHDPQPQTNETHLYEQLSQLKPLKSKSFKSSTSICLNIKETQPTTTITSSSTPSEQQTNNDASSSSFHHQPCNINSCSMLITPSTQNNADNNLADNKSSFPTSNNSSTTYISLNGNNCANLVNGSKNNGPAKMSVRFSDALPILINRNIVHHHNHSNNNQPSIANKPKILTNGSMQPTTKTESSLNSSTSSNGSETASNSSSSTSISFTTNQQLNGGEATSKQQLGNNNTNNNNSNVEFENTPGITLKMSSASSSVVIPRRNSSFVPSSSAHLIAKFNQAASANANSNAPGSSTAPRRVSLSVTDL